MVGSVRGVAIHAIVLNGFMLIDEGAPFLGMTRITSLIYGLLHQHRGAVGAMRVVATGATHGTFANGMAIGFIDLHFFLQMAGQANFVLGQRAERFVFVRVHGVAGGTTHIFRCVGATSPIDMIRLMAGQARFALVFETGFGIGTKAQA